MQNKNQNKPTRRRTNNGNRITTPGQIVTKLQTYLANISPDNVTLCQYPTKAGFIFYLGFSSSKELNEYCSQKGKSYERHLSRAYLLLENALNQHMLQVDRKNSNGIVRYMSAQFPEYKDKIDVSQINTVRYMYFPNKVPIGSPVGAAAQKAKKKTIQPVDKKGEDVQCVK